MSKSTMLFPPATATRPLSAALGLVGSGGDGVVLLGNLLLDIAARQGLYGLLVLSYGPQIRGGESAAVLRLSTQPVQYEGDEVDLLLCFRTSDVRRFEGHIRLHGNSRLILEASDEGALPDWLGDRENSTYRYPFARIENGRVVFDLRHVPVADRATLDDHARTLWAAMEPFT